MHDKGYTKASASGAGTLANVNSGPTRGGGSPKSSTDGKSTDGNATNKIATWGCNPAEASPSSSSQSRNRGKSSKSY